MRNAANSIHISVSLHLAGSVVELNKKFRVVFVSRLDFCALVFWNRSQFSIVIEPLITLNRWVLVISLSLPIPTHVCVLFGVNLDVGSLEVVEILVLVILVFKRIRHWLLVYVADAGA